MPGTLLNYAYISTDGKTNYVGQVVADSTSTKYNYQPGQTYAAPGGNYYIANSPGVPTSAPVGSVYQSSYTGSDGVSYNSWHYSAGKNTYYDAKTQPYDPNTGTYTPPAVAGQPAPTPVPQWSTKNGLGSEYAYIKDAAGTYHVYGGGGTNAQVTPSALGTQAYDYQFVYPDGSYYVGKVIDDGTYGYKVGSTGKVGTGTYSIYAAETAKPAATALAGYSYVNLYHAADGTNYPPSDITPGTPYYQKPTGYGGIGTETDYIQKAGGYYQFGQSGPASGATPVTAIPLPS